jgi:hypothetical protein
MDVYTRELHRSFGYFAAWHPGVQLKLGDVGPIEGNVFTRETSLKDKGIAFIVRRDPSKDSLDYASAGSVSIRFKAAGEPSLPGSVLELGQAGATIQFGDKVGVVFQALGCSTFSIEDQESLGKEILELWRSGQWNKTYSIITELIKAESGSVIISSGQAGKLELKAGAKVSAAGFKLADASLDLGIVSESNVQTKIICGTGMTPLFRAKGIQSAFLLSPSFRRRGLTSIDSRISPESDSVFFGDVPFLDESDF